MAATLTLRSTNLQQTTRNNATAMEQKDREELERLFAEGTLKPAASEQEIMERKEAILGGFIKTDNSESFLRTYFAAREFLREHLDEEEVERTLPRNVFHETMRVLFHLNVPEEDFYRFDKFASKLLEPTKRLDLQSRYHMQEEYRKMFSECRSYEALNEAFINARENIACHYGREEADNILPWNLKNEERFMNEAALAIYLNEEADRATDVCVNDFLKNEIGNAAEKLSLSCRVITPFALANDSIPPAPEPFTDYASVIIKPEHTLYKTSDKALKNATKLFNAALLDAIKKANSRYGANLIVVKDPDNELEWKVYPRKDVSLDALFEGIEQE